MSLEIWTWSESFFAKVALPWFFTSVDKFVLLQVCKLSERFRAFCALEGSLASVHASMNLKNPLEMFQNELETCSK